MYSISQKIPYFTRKFPPFWAQFYLLPNLECLRQAWVIIDQKSPAESSNLYAILKTWKFKAKEICAIFCYFTLFAPSHFLSWIEKVAEIIEKKKRKRWRKLRRIEGKWWGSVDGVRSEAGNVGRMLVYWILVPLFQ